MKTVTLKDTLAAHQRRQEIEREVGERMASGASYAQAFRDVQRTRADLFPGGTLPTSKAPTERELPNRQAVAPLLGNTADAEPPRMTAEEARAQEYRRALRQQRLKYFLQCGVPRFEAERLVADQFRAELLERETPPAETTAVNEGEFADMLSPVFKFAVA